MAISLRKELETYIDCPLSNFPLSEDYFDRMSDVNSVLRPLVRQFNEYAAAENFEACNNLLRNNPDLVKCLLNADKFNSLRDAIIAVERFMLDNIQEFINTVAQSVVGINDNPTAEEASLVSYSAEKVDELLMTRYITLPVSEWIAENGHYIQSITVESLTEDMDPILVAAKPESVSADEQKAYMKAYSILCNGTAETVNGGVTFIVFKLPKTDITVGLKGE